LRTVRVIGMQSVRARSPRLTLRPSACHPGKVLIGPGSSLRSLYGISGLDQVAQEDDEDESQWMDALSQNAIAITFRNERG
jgi:hypothetical protein